MLRRLRGGRVGAEPSIHLAAFGKHPGWDDHIPDLGLETGRLIDTKRVLYLEGIGGNISSGAWDELPAEHRLPQFRHVFLSVQDSDWVLGRMWSSTDGKGRSSYPMVVCAECRGAHYRVIGRIVFDRLEALEAKCKATDSGPEVTTLSNAARDDLRSGVAGRAPRVPDAGPDPITILAGRGELGQDRVGLIRLLYHLDRENAEFRRPSPANTSQKVKSSTWLNRLGKMRPQYARVPACAEHPFDTLALWADFLADQYAPGVPRWVICPLDERWTDLVIGPPSKSEFFCLRASPAKTPLTSDIPYQVDDSLLQQVNSLIEESALKDR